MLGGNGEYWQCKTVSMDDADWKPTILKDAKCPSPTLISDQCGPVCVRAHERDDVWGKCPEFARSIICPDPR